MDHILLIDSSGDNGFVAVGSGGALASIRTATDSRNYASTLNLQVDETLSEAGITLADLATIAVCGGPGSYTGLRIGLATAKGYCYVLDKPLMMHNKLLLLAVQQYYKHLLKYDNYTAILPARDKEYFISSYNNNLEIIIQPTHVFEHETEALLAGIQGKQLLTGGLNPFLKGISESAGIHTEANDVLDAHSWVRYAFEQLNCNSFVNLANSEPFYLKDVYTHKPNKISDISK